MFIEPAMTHVFKSWEGPTGRFIDTKAWRVETLGKLTCGYETGRLMTSISTDNGHAPGGDLEAHVGSSPTGGVIGYAFWHHEGTRPHEIRPRFKKVLRFAKSGIVLYRRRVWHPGTPPTHYLSKWLSSII